MRTRYVTDKQAAICMDGIRTVQRTDAYESGFSLRIGYKNNNFNVKYDTRAQRDDTFERICAALEANNKKEITNAPDC